MIATTRQVTNTNPRMTPSTGARKDGVPPGLTTAEGSVGRGLEELAVAWYGYQVVIFEVLYGCWKSAFNVAFEETVAGGAV
jgi:hypothetical protein